MEPREIHTHHTSDIGMTCRLAIDYIALEGKEGGGVCKRPRRKPISYLQKPIEHLKSNYWIFLVSSRLLKIQ